MSVTLPDFVDYPELFSVKQNLSLFNKLYCYIIEPYQLSGYSVYVGFRDGNVYTRIADWSSREIDLSAVRHEAVDKLLGRIQPLATLLKSARIPDCLLFFSGDDLLLVDAMVSANKFMGPGMLRDLFAKIFKVQVVKSIVVLDDKEIENNTGCFVKPSRFRDMLDGNLSRPLYGVLDAVK